MDFELSGEQQMLRDNVVRLMKDRYGFEARKGYQASPRGWSEALWREYADMGLLGAPFSEDDGGYGGGAVETMIVMEDVRQGAGARTLSPDRRPLRRADQARRQSRKACRAHRQDRSGRSAAQFRPRREAVGLRSLSMSALTARKDGAAFVLNGEKGLVGQGDSADALIVSARLGGGRRDRDGIGLFLVDANAPGVTRRGYPTQDGQRAAEIAFANVRVEPKDVLGEPGRALPVIERAVDETIAAVSAEAVGRDERGADDDGRIHEDAQAVRRDDRLVPGAAAPRCGHDGRARAGAQHDVSGDDDGGRGGRQGTRQGDFRRQGPDRPLGQVHRPAGGADCMAASG